jgi:hypothetical protein
MLAVCSGSATAMHAIATSGTALVASSGSGVGINASSNSADGIDAFTASNTGIAVSGMTQGTLGTSTGVFGSAPSGRGVSGSSANGRGVYGVSTNAWGVYGESTGNGSGVAGIATAGIGVYAQTASSVQPAMYAEAFNSSSLSFYGSGGIHLDGSLAEKVGGGSWTAPSDRRIKKDVKDLDRGLSELMRVRPVTFKYNGLGGTTDDGKEYVGVIAQELETVVPSMVSTRSAKLHKDDAQDTKIEIVDPSAFTYLLINAVKKQQRTIETQERQLATQDARITDLERRIAPVAASTLPGGSGAWVALALLPIGLLISRKRR